ncbi:MAG: diguanylate cyclase, partial [Anaerolineales bacterium]|nr:diguanylate cyclase [Anaerolineales bacterium]
EDLQSEASMISDSVSSGNLVRKISQRMKKDGSLVDVEIVGVPVTVSGEKIGILGLYHDISQRINAEKALKESETRFRILFDESPISLWEEDFSEVKQFLDQIGDKEEIIKQLMKDFELANQCLQKVKIIDVNQATVDLYNANSKQQLIKGLADVLVVESLEQFRGELIALINDQTSHECEIYQKKITGELVYGWLRLSLPPGYEDTWERVFISILDITDRKQAEEKLRFLSFHDTLTGLYNRAYFEEELKRLSSSRQFPVSIIVCDLDNLKQINDTLGHAVGDQAIKAAATILGMSVFRKEDVVARNGGDEYAVILPNVDINEKPEIQKRLEASIDLFNKNIDDDGLYRPISISCGYAVILPGGSLDEGFKEADANMYIAKQKKKM